MRGMVVVGLALASCALTARAETFAVLAVDAEAKRDGAATSAASAVRTALTEQGVRVLDAPETARRLAQPRGVAGHDSAALKRRLDKAEEAHAALDTNSSVSILQGVVDDLARDPEFTVEKQRILEEARLRLATRLLSLAGPRETGGAETPEGRRAMEALLEALRANPTLTLDEARFPPKMRRLLQGATDAYKRLGLGGLSVTSRPVGAHVFVEGREVGVTPLKLANVIARGRYRVWAELDGARSITHTLDVGERTPELAIDLQFDGALWPEGPGLKPLAGTAIDEEVAKKVGRFVDVDKLLLVGISQYDDARWLYAASFSVGTSSIARRGAVRMDAETTEAAAARELAGFLSTGASTRDVAEAPVPAQVLPTQRVEVVRAPDGSVKVIEAAAVEEPPSASEGFPWVWVGVGAGIGAAVLVAAGITTAVLVVTAPKDGVVTGRVEVLE